MILKLNSHLQDYPDHDIIHKNSNIHIVHYLYDVTYSYNEPNQEDDPDDIDNPDFNDVADDFPEFNDNPVPARTPLGKMTNRNIPLTVFGLTFLMWAIGQAC